MKLKIGFVVVATAFLFVTALVSAQTKGGGFSDAQTQQANWYADSVAFVVGINSYSQGWGRLSAGVSDAKKMAKTLRKRGFTVFELYDTKAKGPEIIKQLRKAAQRVGKNDRFVFYYSGHGHTQRSAFDDSEIGYLVPIEGRSGDTTSYIPMDQLRTEIMNNCAAKHVLVVVDSCFSGTLLTRSTIADSSISDYLSKKGIYGITAGMQDQPAVDGLFTNVLVEGMNGNADYNGDGYVTFKELGMYAENNVKAKNRHQTPDYGVMYGAGQFVFARAGETVAPPDLKPPVSAKSTWVPPDTDYDAIAQAEQQRIEAVKATETKNRAAKQKAIRKTYAKVKGYKQSSDYSTSAKKKIFKQFLSDFPDDNPYYDEVDGWYNEPEADGDMAHIPAGWFNVGCSSGDSQCSNEEKPRKRVYVDAFYMDVHEVTNAEYRSCVSSGSCEAIDESACYKLTDGEWETGGNLSSSFKGSDQPVVCVNWKQARSYCSAQGKRLPTEAEWEKAARGGTSGAIYGNLDSVAWYRDNSNKKTHPVGQKQPNAYGLYDTLGNVYEWCEDWYDEDYYSRIPERNPANRTKATYRVLRGGSWDYNPQYLRASNRFGLNPTFGNNNFGFRCSRD